MNRLLILLVVATSFTGCEYYASVHKRPLVALNKTSYEFPREIDAVRIAIHRGFSAPSRYDVPYKVGLVNDLEADVFFTVESKGNDSTESADAVRARVLRENSNVTDLPGQLELLDSADAILWARDSLHGVDFLLNQLGVEYYLSPIYTVRGKPVLVSTTFSIHLEAVSDSSTMVTVQADYSRFTRGMLQFGEYCLFLRTDTLASTTVEEYLILQYLGRILDVTDMPPVILPE